MGRWRKLFFFAPPNFTSLGGSLVEGTLVWFAPTFLLLSYQTSVILVILLLLFCMLLSSSNTSNLLHVNWCCKCLKTLSKTKNKILPEFLTSRKRCFLIRQLPVTALAGSFPVLCWYHFCRCCCCFQAEKGCTTWWPVRRSKTPLEKRNKYRLWSLMA